MSPRAPPGRGACTSTQGVASTTSRDGGDVLAADLERVVGGCTGGCGLGRGARAGRRERRRERREQLRLRRLVRRPAHRERRRVRRDQHLHRDLDGRAALLAAGQRRDRRDRPRLRRVHGCAASRSRRGRRVAAQILGEGAAHRRHGSHRSFSALQASHPLQTDEAVGWPRIVHSLGAGPLDCTALLVGWLFVPDHLSLRV